MAGAGQRVSKAGGPTPMRTVTAKLRTRLITRPAASPPAGWVAAAQRARAGTSSGAAAPKVGPPPGWVAAAKKARAQQAVQLSAAARALARGSGGKAAPGGHRSAGEAARSLARGSGWTAGPNRGQPASTPTPAAGGKGGAAGKPKGGKGGKGGKGHGEPGSAKHEGGKGEGKGRKPSNLGALGGFARQAAGLAAGVVMSAAQKVASKVPQG